jgi:putative SOS response-associated peptidase YedK
MAGLWERWSGPDGNVLETCTILTTEANEALRPLHERMPVILEPGAYGAWLDPASTNADDVKALLRPFAGDALAFDPVSTRVNSPRNDDPSCIEPVAAP